MKWESVGTGETRGIGVEILRLLIRKECQSKEKEGGMIKYRIHSQSRKSLREFKEIIAILGNNLSKSSRPYWKSSKNPLNWERMSRYPASANSMMRDAVNKFNSNWAIKLLKNHLCQD